MILVLILLALFVGSTLLVVWFAYRRGYADGMDRVILAPLEVEDLPLGEYTVLSLVKSSASGCEVATLTGQNIQKVRVKVVEGLLKEGETCKVFERGVWPA